METATVRTSDGPMEVVVARPASAEPAPAVVVIQEAFGVNDHIRDVCQRLSQEGFVAAAPDMFHRFPHRLVPYGDRDLAMSQIGQLTANNIVEDIGAAVELLRDDTRVRGVPAVVGFCFGGKAAFSAATELQLSGAACFYGGRIAGAPDAPIDHVDGLRCPVLLVYGGQDPVIDGAQRAAVAAGLAGAGKRFAHVCYEDAGHAFFNDQRPENYVASAAEAAWQELLGFLDATARR
jgi:carboxymethylenebutenolidase